MHRAVLFGAWKGGAGMNYIENIYICLVAPLIVVILCLKGRRRRTMLFFLSGMTACLAASYISTFLAMLHGADMALASIEISPMVEEVLKLAPVLFYLLVLEPEREEITGAMLMVAVGFATFENACYLTGNGSTWLLHLLIRGFGTGAMHVISGMIVGMGLYYLWNRLYLRFAGTAGLLSLAITYHAIYNLLVAQSGAAARVGYHLPMLTVLLALVFGRKRLKNMTR